MCTTGTTRTTKDLRALRGACLGKPVTAGLQWVLCRDREFHVATNMAHPAIEILVSRQGVRQQGLSVSQHNFVVATRRAASWVGFVS